LNQWAIGCLCGALVCIVASSPVTLLDDAIGAIIGGFGDYAVIGCNYAPLIGALLVRSLV
jgi:hypothetical protein